MLFYFVYIFLCKQSFDYEVHYGDILPLYNIDRGQAGAYLCIATNDVPPAVSKRISLSVNYPPELRLSHEVISAPVGSDIRIFCYIRGYPIEHTYWTYRNYTLPRRYVQLLDPFISFNSFSTVS
uniref:Uncharacterized protein n=1 Tax=Rhodnius prolixus TaxID=13249 RepID=T1I9X0_RHOPR